MRVSELQEFLRNLGGSLAAIGVQQKSLDDLQSVASGFAPFKGMELAQVVDFLRRAAEYREDGKVHSVDVPGLNAASETARRLSETVQELNGSGPHQATELVGQLTEAQTSLQSALTTLSGSFGLTVSFKPDKAWLPTIIKKATAKRESEAMKGATAEAVAALRALSSQITSPESYQDETAKSRILELSGLKPEVLKAAALEAGAADVSAGKAFDGKKFTEAVLVKITGVEIKSTKSPSKPKSKKSGVTAATDEQVETMVKSLKEMVQRAKDPTSVSDGEIAEVLTGLTSNFTESQVKSIALGVTGEKAAGRGKAAVENAINLLRKDLTAVRRLLESQNA